jgi:hypothetical protein
LSDTSLKLYYVSPLGDSPQCCSLLQDVQTSLCQPAASYRSERESETMTASTGRRPPSALIACRVGWHKDVWNALYLPPAFTLVSSSVYSSTLKIEATCPFETSVEFRKINFSYPRLREPQTIHSCFLSPSRFQPKIPINKWAHGITRLNNEFHVVRRLWIHGALPPLP